MQNALKLLERLNGVTAQPGSRELAIEENKLLADAFETLFLLALTEYAAAIPNDERQTLIDGYHQKIGELEEWAQRCKQSDFSDDEDQTFVPDLLMMGDYSGAVGM